MTDAALFRDLSGLRVLFAHQSVGANIVEGVRELAAEAGAQWRVTGAMPSVSEGSLTHVRVGENGRPLSKTAEFCRLVTSEPGARLDLALHKYCYVDIDARTDVHGLFGEYARAMRALRQSRPELILVHVTVPLVRVRTGFRAWVRQAVGRRSPRVADNASRHAFNELMRREYTGREPVFDLAAAEAAGGGTPSLNPRFTDDGGHLNRAGRRHVAGALLACVRGAVLEGTRR